MYSDIFVNCLTLNCTKEEVIACLKSSIESTNGYPLVSVKTAHDNVLVRLIKGGFGGGPYEYDLDIKLIFTENSPSCELEIYIDKNVFLYRGFLRLVIGGAMSLCMLFYYFHYGPWPLILSFLPLIFLIQGLLHLFYLPVYNSKITYVKESFSKALNDLI